MTYRDPSVLDWTRDQQMAYIRETFKNAGWQTQRVLDAMSDAKVRSTLAGNGSSQRTST